jgi:Tfp pilus assembly protein PilF
MGMLYLNMGNFNEGVNYLVKAIQQNNDNAQAYFFLGYAYAIQGNRSNASIYFQRAAKLNPGYAQQAQEILNKMN